jgi:hypothetical protein
MVIDEDHGIGVLRSGEQASLVDGDEKPRRRSREQSCSVRRDRQLELRAIVVRLLGQNGRD